MANVLELLVRARDEASAVLDKVGETGERVAQGLRDHWMAVTAAGAAAGVAFEALARAQAPLTESTQRLALVLGMTEGEVRELVTELGNVTLPLSTVLALMEQGRRQGLESAEALREYVTFWDMVADATGESAEVLAQAGVALRTVGIAAGEESQAMAAFGFITRETTSSIGDFLRFLELSGPEIREMGLNVDQTAAVLGILEREFGIAGRTAMRVFREAITRSEGDMRRFLAQLRISPDLFARYTRRVTESNRVIREQAEIHARSYTWMQRLQHGVSELMYRFGGWIGRLTVLSPLLMAMGPIIMGIVHAKQLWATATWLLHAAKSALLGPIGILLGIIGVGGALLVGLLGMRGATEDAATATRDLTSSYVDATREIPPLEDVFTELTRVVVDQERSARDLESAVRESKDELLRFHEAQVEARHPVEELTAGLALQADTQARLRREAQLEPRAIAVTRAMDDAIARHVAAVEAVNRLDAALTTVRGNIERHGDAYDALGVTIETLRGRVAEYDRQVVLLWEQYQAGEIAAEEYAEASERLIDLADTLDEEIDTQTARRRELTAAIQAETAAIGPLETAIAGGREEAQEWALVVGALTEDLQRLHAIGEVYLTFLERWELWTGVAREALGPLRTAVVDTGTVIGEISSSVQDVAAAMDELGIETGVLTEEAIELDDAIRHSIEQTTKYRDAVGKTGPRITELKNKIAAYETQLKSLEAAYRAGIITTDVYNSEMTEIKAVLDETGKALTEVEREHGENVRAVDTHSRALETNRKRQGELRDAGRDTVSWLDLARRAFGRIETVIRGASGALELYAKVTGLVNALGFGPAGLAVLALVAVVSLLGITWEDAGEMAQGARDIIVGVAQRIWEVVSGVVQRVGEIIAMLFRMIFDLKRRLADIFLGLMNFIGGLFRRFWDMIRGILNFAIDGINLVIRLLNLIRIPNWVPVIGGFGINIPEIPRLHQGGVYRAPQGATEGLALLRHGEVVLPPSSDFGALAKAIAKELKPAFAPNVTIVSPAPMDRAEMIRAQRKEIQRLAMVWEGVG